MRGAERDCRHALSLSLDLHGAQHRATVDARRQLAALLVDQGRLSEAEAEFGDTHAWLVARLGQEHADVARNYNSLAIVAWERGDIDAALRDIRQAIGTWRRQHHPQLLASGLFNQAMILHGAGRMDEARPLLVESLKLRSAQFGAGHGLVGDTWRLLGEVDAARGREHAARTALERSFRLTTASYGPAHSHTQRAALSLAYFDAQRGDADALQRLDALAALPDHDHELRKIAWRARAYAAEVRCTGASPKQALATFDALMQTITQAQPEGGSVVREIEAARRRCVEVR
jgi:serine/threonine-protein kinase